MRTATAPEGWIPFVRSIARDAKLKVVIGHNVGAATDGKTLWLPALPAELTHDDLVMLKGDTFHEVGHILRSNIKFFQAFSKEHGSFGQFLLNALDDVFMEGRQAAWKKTAERYLLDSTMILINRGRFRDGSAGLGEAVACYCLAYLTEKRWPSVGKATKLVEVNLRKHLAQHADKVIPALTSLLDAEFPAVSSTEDGGALALKIIDLLKELSEQEQSQPNPSNESGEGEDGSDETGETDPSQPASSESKSEPKGEGEDKGEQGTSEPEGEGKGDGKDDDSKADPQGDGEGHGNTGDPKSEEDGKGGKGKGQANPDDSGSDPKGEGQGEGEGNEAGSKSSGTGSGKPDGVEGKDGDEGEGQNPTQANTNNGKSLKELVDEMLKEKLGDQEVFDKGSAVEELAKGIASGANKDYANKPLIKGLVIDFSVGAGKAEGFEDGMAIVEADKEMAKVIAEVTGRKANVMGNRLRALLANRDETDEYDSRNGRLCERNLHRFALNDSRIFAKADERIDETAAVSVTADLSGSTGISANGTSTAEQIRIALTLIEKVLHSVGTPREILGFAPNSGQLNCMVKTFGDSHRVALDRIAGMHNLVGGGSTPIGDAVIQAGSRLMCHEAQRKLLFVITDGLPDNAQKAVEMTNTVVKTGVDVIYLVIGSDKACEWLESAKIKFARSENAEGLIPAMVEKMAEFLA